MDLHEKINKKFNLKYGAFGCMIAATVMVISITVMQFLLSIERYVEIGTTIMGIILVICAIALNYRYWKFDLRGNLSEKEYVIEFIDYFAHRKFDNSRFKYIESLRWFSKEINKLYHADDNAKVLEIDGIVNDLFWILKPTGQGVCKATSKQSEFVLLCEEISYAIKEEQKTGEKVANLISKISNVDEPVLTVKEFIGRVIHETALMYMIIVVLQVLGAAFVEESLRTWIGTCLMSIPEGILVVLVYYKVVKEHSS